MNEQLHRAAMPPSPTSSDPVARDGDPASLERDIDHTRERISRTVDALEQKLSPSEFADQAFEVVRNRGGEFATNLMDQVQRNPLPAIVTAAGLLWLMSASGNARRWPYPESNRGGHLREKAGHMSDRAGEMASGLAARGADVAHSVAGAAHSVTGAAQSVKEGVSNLGTQLSQGAERVRHDADRALNVVREGSRRASSEFEHLLSEQPIVVGAIGMAIGAAIGALLPATEAEDRAMGSASDAVTSKLGSLSSEGLEIAREKASEVADQLGKSSAESTGGKVPPGQGTS